MSVKTFNAFDDYCKILVYGYCRVNSHTIPDDILRLCLLWFNPNTICLLCRIHTGEHLRIMVHPRDTILEIKFQIRQKKLYPVEHQSLWLPSLGKLLHDEMKVHDYNLHDNDVLLMKLRR